MLWNTRRDSARSNRMNEPNHEHEKGTAMNVRTMNKPRVTEHTTSAIPRNTVAGEVPVGERESSQAGSRARARRHRGFRRLLPVLTDETGAATAEYAIVILAAVALAGVLVTIMRSPEVQAMLLELVQRAFATAA